MIQFQIDRKLSDLFFNLLVRLPVIADQIHLVDRKHEIPDPHQCADPCMASCLCQDPLRGVNQDHRKVCKRSSYCHVPRVFLVSGGIRHDKAPVLRREIPVRHVDRDPLLTLRHQSVQQERIVDPALAAPHTAVQLQRTLLVSKQKFGVVQHMSDECRFPVIHTAAGDKFQQTAAVPLCTHIRNTPPSCAVPCSRLPHGRSRGSSAPMSRHRASPSRYPPACLLSTRHRLSGDNIPMSGNGRSSAVPPPPGGAASCHRPP